MIADKKITGLLFLLLLLSRITVHAKVSNIFQKTEDKSIKARAEKIGKNIISKEAKAAAKSGSFRY